MSTRAFKFLRGGRVGPFSGFAWPLDRWVAADDATPCERGVHACRAADLPFWIDAELWHAELDGAVRETPVKLVAERGRLLEPVAAWGEELAAAFAEDCARAAVARAAAALRERGRGEDGDRLQAPGSLATLAARAAGLAKGETDAALARAIGLAADASKFAQGPFPRDAAVAGFIATEAAADKAGERARQADWLAARLAG